jgi:hypothetical protein
MSGEWFQPGVRMETARQTCNEQTLGALTLALQRSVVEWSSLRLLGLLAVFF